MASPSSYWDFDAVWQQKNKFKSLRYCFTRTYAFLCKKNMTTVQAFTFNTFQENTYILHDETKECIIIDPGCNSAAEKKQLTDFIRNQSLKPVRLLNTHCHIDHIFGNKFISEQYGLGLEIPEGELQWLKGAVVQAQFFGIPYKDHSPMPSKFIELDSSITFGNTKLQVLFTPGHSEASVSFYDATNQYVIAGDVLFRGSIGRTDLPGGDYETLIQSIKTQLLELEDETVVYCGHGPSTTIGLERKTNPFLQG